MLFTATIVACHRLSVPVSGVTATAEPVAAGMGTKSVALSIGENRHNLLSEHKGLTPFSCSCPFAMAAFPFAEMTL